MNHQSASGTEGLTKISSSNSISYTPPCMGMTKVIAIPLIPALSQLPIGQVWDKLITTPSEERFPHSVNFSDGYTTHSNQLITPHGTYDIQEKCVNNSDHTLTLTVNPAAPFKITFTFSEDSSTISSISDDAAIRRENAVLVLQRNAKLLEFKKITKPLFVITNDDLSACVILDGVPYTVTQDNFKKTPIPATRGDGKLGVLLKTVEDDFLFVDQDTLEQHRLLQENIGLSQPLAIKNDGHLQATIGMKTFTIQMDLVTLRICAKNNDDSSKVYLVKGPQGAVALSETDYGHLDTRYNQLTKHRVDITRGSQSVKLEDGNQVWLTGLDSDLPYKAKLGQTQGRLVFQKIGTLEKDRRIIFIAEDEYLNLKTIKEAVGNEKESERPFCYITNDGQTYSIPRESVAAPYEEGQAILVQQFPKDGAPIDGLLVPTGQGYMFNDVAAFKETFSKVGTDLTIQPNFASATLLFNDLRLSIAKQDFALFKLGQPLDVTCDDRLGILNCNHADTYQYIPQVDLSQLPGSRPKPQFEGLENCLERFMSKTILTENLLQYLLDLGNQVQILLDDRTNPNDIDHALASVIHKHITHTPYFSQLALHAMQTQYSSLDKKADTFLAAWNQGLPKKQQIKKSAVQKSLSDLQNLSCLCHLMTLPTLQQAATLTEEDGDSIAQLLRQESLAPGPNRSLRENYDLRVLDRQQTPLLYVILKSLLFPTSIEDFVKTAHDTKQVRKEPLLQQDWFLYEAYQQLEQATLSSARASGIEPKTNSLMNIIKVAQDLHSHFSSAPHKDWLKGPDGDVWKRLMQGLALIAKDGEHFDTSRIPATFIRRATSIRDQKVRINAEINDLLSRLERHETVTTDHALATLRHFFTNELGFSSDSPQICSRALEKLLEILSLQGHPTNNCGLLRLDPKTPYEIVTLKPGSESRRNGWTHKLIPQGSRKKPACYLKYSTVHNAFQVTQNGKSPEADGFLAGAIHNQLGHVSFLGPRPDGHHWMLNDQCGYPQVVTPHLFDELAQSECLLLTATKPDSKAVLTGHVLSQIPWINALLRSLFYLGLRPSYKDYERSIVSSHPFSGAEEVTSEEILEQLRPKPVQVQAKSNRSALEARQRRAALLEACLSSDSD